jgi:hypothetical protein
VSSAFKDAVLQTKGLEEAYRVGLRAIRKRDRERITCKDGRRLTGSVDIDRTLSISHPDDNRWDYGIGVDTTSELVVWVEIHAASSNHVQAVIDKLNWLRNWLRTDAPSLQQLTARFAWVASGKVALTRNSPQRRRVAQAGIYFAGERIQVDAI